MTKETYYMTKETYYVAKETSDMSLSKLKVRSVFFESRN
jgi:hypothetical protein